jgi:hypothetical protein
MPPLGLVGEVDDMIWQAVHAGFAYFQRQAGYTRTGSHNTRVHGRETGQWHKADLAVAHWLQHSGVLGLPLQHRCGVLGVLEFGRRGRPAPEPLGAGSRPPAARVPRPARDPHRRLGKDH